MLQKFALAGLALAPFADARLGRLQARGQTGECCPCTASEQPSQGTITLTVTETASPAAAKTVVIEHTVTQPANTIYVTQGDTQQSVTETTSPAEKVTVTVSPSETGANVETQTLEKGSPQEPETVTVSVNPAGDKTVTITPGQTSSPSEAKESPSVVTVTLTHSAPESTEPAKETSPTDEEETQQRVVTKTIVPDGQRQQGPKTITIEPATSLKTITAPGGSVYTETVTASEPITVTAAPETETVSAVSHSSIYQTVTKTVSDGHGDVNIQVVVININNGVPAQCWMQSNGMPCPGFTPGSQPHWSNSTTTMHSMHNTTSLPRMSMTSVQNTTTSCPELTPSTSIATAYNTVLVTASASMGLNYNSTVPQGVAMPSGSGMVTARKPRAPLSRRW